MNIRFSMLLLIAIALPMCITGAVAANPPGLTISPDGKVMRAGKPYRAIGVNYVSAFTRVLNNPNDTSYNEGFKVLKDKGIPYVRMWAMGYWPKENALYNTNRAEYFKRMDEVVKSAEKYGIGIIPSMFFCFSTVPDMVGEPMDQWANPASKTNAFMRTFVKEMVTRYGKSKAIWGWEFGNEINLGADLPNASDWRPPVWTDLGTPKTRSARDEITHDIMRNTLRLFATEIRKYDKTRPIITGNSFPRQSAYHQMTEHSWKADTEEQFAMMFKNDNPDPVNTLCGHFYLGELDRFGRKLTVQEHLTLSMEAARKAGKPLVVGEFGTSDNKNPEQAKKDFHDIIMAIEKVGVPLSMMWVYDFSPQDTDWNVTATNARAYVLDEISEANKRIEGKL